MDEKLVEEILAEYSAAEIKLLEIVKNLALVGIDSDIDQKTWYRQKLNNIQALKKEAEKVLMALKDTDTTAKKVILQAYLSGGNKDKGFIKTNEDAIKAITQKYLNVLGDSRLQMLRSTNDAYKKIIYDVSKKPIIGANTRIQAARKALSSFADEGLSSFVGSDGRQWEIRSYVEMASRTTVSNALREGRLSRLESEDKDLILIDSVPNPSPLCTPYEGKVLSISGDSDKYDSLDSAVANGLFHPNCRHSFTAYTEGLTPILETDSDKGFDDYDAMQQQRYLERGERQWKRREAIADTPETKAYAHAKVTDWKDRLKEHIDDFDLQRKPNRESNIAAR